MTGRRRLLLNERMGDVPSFRLLLVRLVVVRVERDLPRGAEDGRMLLVRW